MTPIIQCRDGDEGFEYVCRVLNACPANVVVGVLVYDEKDIGGYVGNVIRRCPRASLQDKSEKCGGWFLKIKLGSVADSN